MTTLEFLLDLRQRGVDVELQGDKLVVRAARNALPPDLSAELRDRKAEITAFLTQGIGERSAGHAPPPIRPVPRRELMPLSFTQERLWYLTQVENNKAVFNLPLCLEITGRLDVELLQRCLDEIATRHEVMRTTVVVNDGVGFQRIHPPGGLPLRLVDLRGADNVSARSAAVALLDRDAAEPFDLLARPGFRVSVVRYSEDGFFLLLVIHHMFVDGTSQNILMDELITSYDAAVAGTASPLAPVPLQFADYAVWQRGWLQGPALDEQLDFWRQRLEGASQVLELPTDFPRPAIRGSNGGKEPLRLPRQASQRLLAIAQEEGATPFMAMVALVNILLHRYTGQEDILVGAPVANRARRETESIVGYIANTFVLRTDLTGSPSFREVVRRVRQMCVGAFRHQDMPFQKVVEALHPVRDLSRTPIYQVFLTYDEVFVQPTRMGGLRLKRIIVGSTVARQDMSLFLRRVGDEVHGSIEYSVDLFRRETIVRLIGHLGALTESASASPDASISDLAIITPEERELLASINRTTLPVPALSVHGVVEAQARRTPERIALRDDVASMSYAQMIRAADALAASLRQRGVGANDLVGVCLNRANHMVVALLAVLKTGAAYVPLDPDFPTARLAYMIEDAALSVIVCQSATAAIVAAPERVLVNVEDDRTGDTLGHAAAVTPDSRAYVIYTSGSTGRPKGVELRHGNVVNCLTAFAQRPGIAPDDVLVAVTTLSFDIAVLELFLPLIRGGTVVIASRDVASDGVRLGRLLTESGAAIMQATPATWRLLLDSGWSGSPGLRALCGGEALTNDLAQALLPRVRELWNMYGPTETTVWSTCTRIEDASAPITVGTPIANTTIRIVDARGALVPLGVPGELLIGGQGVASGYLGRPELTAERFITDPTGISPGAVFYRTGDVVRMEAGGHLLHLGRSDTQVKVRGHRIELGEIEAALRAMPAVTEAVVSVHSKGTTDARLVAYVIYGPGEQPVAREVRDFLRQHLPQYMVPSFVVAIDRIPRTPNGKVDRARLPDPLGSGRDTPRASSAEEQPRSDAERVIAAIWRELLGVHSIGRHDNFFDLGGESLLTMRVVARMNRAFQVDIPVRAIFEAPTVAALGLAVEDAILTSMETMSDGDIARQLNDR